MDLAAPSGGAAGAGRWMEELRVRLAAASRRRPQPVSSQRLRRAAVLVPLFVREGKLWAVFTRRTETVEHHRGQISFPGGAQEPEDVDLLETALRESHEELGLMREDVLALGTLSPMVTITDFYVEPFVGAIPEPYVFQPAEAEIAEVLEVPIPALLDPTILETRRLPGRQEIILFYHYGRHVIWGATARILSELLEVLK